MADVLSPTAVQTALADLPGWAMEADGRVIARSLKLKDFSEAFGLMTRIALLAEMMGHHPDWSNVYNRLSVRLTTHDAGGVTEKDLTMARAINAMVA